MKRVLIVDDAAFMRMMIKDILTKNGYEIAAEAENGAIAVEKYPEAKPDLVLMDITMPEMDGIEALKKIKAADANASFFGYGDSTDETDSLGKFETVDANTSFYLNAEGKVVISFPEYSIAPGYMGIQEFTITK